MFQKSLCALSCVDTFDSALGLMHKAIMPGAGIAALDELRRCGASVDAVDEDGYTALHVAAAAGRADVVRWLLDSGADPSIQAFDGRTALHAAAAVGHLEACELICDACERTPCLGVDPLIRAIQVVDADGKRPAELAQMARNMGVVRLLLERAHARVAPKRKAAGSSDVALTLSRTSHSGRATATVLDRRGEADERLHGVYSLDPMLHSPVRSASSGSVFNHIREA
jgi:ankyrin repeat protein